MNLGTIFIARISAESAWTVLYCGGGGTYRIIPNTAFPGSDKLLEGLYLFVEGV